MKFQVIVSALAGLAMAHYSEQKPEAPCSDKASAVGHLPSAAPVLAASSWAPAAPAYSAPASPHQAPPVGNDDEEEECECKKKKKVPASSWAPPAHPTGAVAPYVPSNGSYPSTPSNYTNPSQTYTPAQQTTNAGAHHGPALAGVFGLAAVLALL